MKIHKPLMLKLALLSVLVFSADAALADRWHNNRGWRGHDRHWDHGHRHRHDNIRWSVNLNVGAPSYWGSYGRTWRSYPYGWRTFYSPPPTVVVQQPPPVIIQQNTYVPPSSGGTSLFRDRYGRCYERSYNTLGTEIRTELPASACNF
jgi:hypothetical protein